LTGDFTGDGILDLLPYGGGSGFYQGDGHGGFQLEPGLEPPFYVTGDGDFDGDGVLDITVYNNAAAKWEVYLGDGTGHFPKAQALPGGWIASVPRAPLLVAGSIAITDHAPVANNVQVSAFAGSTLMVPLAPHVSDPDNEPVRLTAFGKPAHGTVLIDDNGTPDDPADDALLYTATPGYSGSESFAYTVADAAGVEASATVSVNVTVAVPILTFDANSYVVDENASSHVVTITVVRTGPTNQPSLVNYATADGTAFSSADYFAASGTLNFAARETSKTISVTVVDDQRAQGNRAFQIALSDPSNGAQLGSPSSATVTIVDDDKPGFQVTPTSGLLTYEGRGSTNFTVRLNSVPTASVTIQLASSDTTEGTVSPATLEFTPANALMPQTLTVTGVDDNVIDGNQPFTIFLRPAVSADPGYDGLDPADVAGSNVDLTSSLQFSAASYTVDENAASHRVIVTIRRTDYMDKSVSMHFATADDTAHSSADYLAASGTLNFGAGQTTETFGVTVVDNHVSQGNRAFQVVLSNPTSGTQLGTPSFATVTIVDDDKPGFQVTPTSGLFTDEGGLRATFTVRLTTVPTANVTIQLESSDTTEGTVSPATLVFTASNGLTPQTVTVTGVRDGVVDGDQPYTIFLRPAVSADTGYNGLDPADVAVTNRDVANVPPVAADDLFDLGLTIAPITSSTSVLTNDTDVDNDVLTAIIATNGASGVASLRPDGTFTYIPGAGFWGVDTFTYRADDGSLQSAPSTVTVMTHNALQVHKFYDQVLHREPDLGGWRFWTDLLNRHVATFGTLASSFFESTERLDPIVAQMYSDCLFRQADQSGKDFWRAIWQKDGAPDRVIAGIVSSPEFFASAGGTNSAWVTQMYNRLLLRQPDIDGLNFWTSNMNAGRLTRPDVVYYFVRSDENYRNLISTWHHIFLNRDANAAEIIAFLQQLKSNKTQRDVQIEIINGQEYFNSPPPPAPGTASRVY
jgi:hypothetical protein